jgi:DNA-damage-inducible protein D
MQAIGLEENKIPAKKGGRVARNARLELEQKTGKKVVSENNFKSLAEQKRLKSK